MATPTNGKDDTQASTLKNIDLWVKINAKNMSRQTEIGIAELLLRHGRETLDEGNKIMPQDILGVQLIWPDWIVYCATAVAKAKILVLGELPVGGLSFEIEDFRSRPPRSLTKTPETRISIHGIPQHVSDAEIEQFIDEHAVRSTAVQKAKVKTLGTAFQGLTLYSGNRFCYASSITDPIPRYTTLAIASPLSSTDLVNCEVTIYHEEQPINCRRCKQMDHQAWQWDCRRQRNKDQQLCFACKQPGHFRNACPRNQDRETRPESDGSETDRNEDSNTTATPTGNTDRPLDRVEEVSPPSVQETSALVQEIIDHTLRNPEAEASSPEMLQKVTNFLATWQKPELQLETPTKPDAKDNKRKDATPPEREKPEKKEKTDNSVDDT